MIYLLKVMIFHNYVCLLESNVFDNSLVMVNVRTMLHSIG